MRHHHLNLYLEGVIYGNQGNTIGRSTRKYSTKHPSLQKRAGNRNRPHALACYHYFKKDPARKLTNCSSAVRKKATTFGRSSKDYLIGRSRTHRQTSRITRHFFQQENVHIRSPDFESRSILRATQKSFTNRCHAGQYTESDRLYLRRS